MDVRFNAKAIAKRSAIGLDADAPYFYSGMLLFDWRETLRQRMLPRALAGC